MGRKQAPGAPEPPGPAAPCEQGTAPSPEGGSIAQCPSPVFLKLTFPYYGRDFTELCFGWKR